MSSRRPPNRASEPVERIAFAAETENGPLRQRWEFAERAGPKPI